MRDGNRAEVCSATFQGILQVGRKRLWNVSKFSWENDGNPRPENRGGLRNGIKVEEVKEKIKAHIMSFHCVASHYGRNKTPYKRYLPGTLNINRMWQMFNQENPTYNVNYMTYYRVFTNNFNLGFGNPKKDVCSYCVGQKMKIANESDDEKKRVLVTELLVHRCRARKFYELMRAKPDDQTIMVSFDLMQNQPLPKTPIGEAFYARQLWLYVLGIIEHKPSGEIDVAGSQQPEDVHFYSWGEQEMSRGSNQVASALYHFLDNRLSTNKNIKKIQLYSDSCVGQNKNSTVLGALNMLAYKHMVEIEHTFPIRGHSYLPADRAFGRVEKKLRCIESILLPSEYLEQFAAVGQVYLHGQDWLTFDFKDAAERHMKKPLPFKITEAKLIKINPFERNVTVCKFYSAQGEKHTVLKRGRRWSAIRPLPLKLESCVKPAKQKDVTKLLQAMGIDVTINLPSTGVFGPQSYIDTVRQFYGAICSHPMRDLIESESDDDDTLTVIYDE